MDPSDCILFSGDARLADYGSLLVFRHWLRCQLQEMAGLDEASLYPFRNAGAETRPAGGRAAVSAEPENYGRLFF